MSDYIIIGIQKRPEKKDFIKYKQLVVNKIFFSDLFLMPMNIQIERVRRRGGKSEREKEKEKTSLSDRLRNKLQTESFQFLL